MKRLLGGLRAFARHPATQLAAGLILLISGGYQIVLDFATAERKFELGVHHSVAAFGLIQILGALPELVEGLDRAFKAVEARERK